MKKLLLIAAVMLSSFAARAQETTSSESTPRQTNDTYMYCQILGASKFMSNKLVITIDFGQEAKFFSDQRLRDENGDPIVFNSMVDAMNWMGNDGWEFMQAYVVTMGQQNVYHWLLRLNLSTSSDQERNEILSKLKTKNDFKEEEQ